MKMTELSKGAKRFKEVCNSSGFKCEIIEFSETTRTSADAAKVIGCKVEQIAKSIVFKTKNTNKSVLVIASGSNRINESRMGDIIGEPIEKSDANFVLEKTGYVIGGVPPFGHKEKIETFIDEDLLKYNEIWAAAGNPNAVFKLTPDDIKKIPDCMILRVT